MIYRTCAALLLLVLSSGASRCEALDLIRDGQQLPAIDVINPDGLPVLSQAERELSRALQIMTGGEAANPPAGRIIICRHADLPEALRTAHPLSGGSKEEIVILRDEDRLYITGASGRGTLQAVYTFLHQVAGVRWLWPGESGERIPQPKQLAIKQAVIQETPAIAYRSFSFSGTNLYDDDAHLWSSRNRLNVANLTPWMTGITPEEAIARNRRLGLLNRWTGHSVILAPEILKAHPEYVAEYSGVRKNFSSHSAHLCWSNPGVQHEVAKVHRELAIRYPGIDIFSLYTADHGQYCQCANCVDMAPDISTRWQLFSRPLIAAIKEVRPDAQVWTLAYDAYRLPPKEVAPYDQIGYTIYNGSYRFPYGSGAKANAAALSQIAKWQEAGGKMGIRNYELIPFSGPGGYLPLVYFMTDQVRYAVAHGLEQYNSEIIPLSIPQGGAPEAQRWNVNRINAYALAQAAWDATLEPEAIVRDWSRAAYGGAAAPMQRYYELMEHAWRHAPGDINSFHHTGAVFMPGYITSELLEEVAPLFREARSLVMGMPAGDARRKALQAVILEQRIFNEWRDVYLNARLPPAIDNLQVQRVGESRWTPLVNGESFKLEWDEKSLHLLWRGITHQDGSRSVRFEHPFETGSGIAISLSLSDGQTSAEHISITGDRTPLPDNAVRAVSKNGEWKMIISRDVVPNVEKPARWIGLSLISGSAGQSHKLWPSDKLRDYGKAYLHERPLPRVAWLEGDLKRPNPMHLVLRSLGWESRRIASVDAEDYDLLIIRSGLGRGRLRADAMSTHLKAFLDRGGMALVIAESTVPLAQWLDDPDSAVSVVAPPLLRRVADRLDQGEWLRRPHDLGKWLRSGTTPVSGFQPQNPEKWRVMASLPLKDGGSRPFMLSRHIGSHGRGTLVLTTEKLGYAGGFTTFGDRNTDRVGPLLENLWQEHKSRPLQVREVHGAASIDPGR